MPDEILMAVATALAAKAADAAAGAAHEAWTRLVRLVRDRLGGDAQGAAALEGGPAPPGGRVAVRELAGALERAAADQAFAAEVRALWLEAEPQLSAAGASAVNVVTGTVGGHLVQARDLHVKGGLHLGNVP